jgi:hypothetical protein
MVKLTTQGYEVLDPSTYLLKVLEAEPINVYEPQIRLTLRVAAGEREGLTFTDYLNCGSEDGVKVGTKAWDVFETCLGRRLSRTYVEEIRKWRSATSYMEKYVAKPEQFPEGVETGRVWGVWNEDLLPIQWETVRVSLKDAYKIRRIYRRLAKMRGKGHLRRLTVFVRHENVVRLLEFLGYRWE